MRGVLASCLVSGASLLLWLSIRVDAALVPACVWLARRAAACALRSELSLLRVG